MDKEKQWIRQIQRKASKTAANALVSKYYKEVYAFVYKQTLDAELSQDLTQEIFINVLRSIGRFEGRKATFRTWLYKLATNRLVDYYRSKQYQLHKRIVPIEDDAFTDGTDLAASLVRRETIEKVAAIVNQLPVTSQHIVRLKLFADYKLKEIADVEQVPLSTVKTRYYAALKRIKQEMGAYHDG